MAKISQFHYKYRDKMILCNFSEIFLAKSEKCKTIWCMRISNFFSQLRI